MKDYGPDSFGTIYAADYDERQDPGNTDASVALIAELASSGRVLEIAVGTGRVALPLAQQGLEVHGIDASQDMLDKLDAKLEKEPLTTSVCNMANVEAPGTFDFAYLIYNTITNLTTQDEQVSCFKSVSAKLNPGGAFLIENFVQDLTMFRDHQYTRTLEVDVDRAILDLGRHDPVNQLVEAQRIVFTDGGTQLRPLPYRYVWPQELDLMAKLAGMHLESRWGDWDQSPFTRDSRKHISLYRKD